MHENADSWSFHIVRHGNTFEADDPPQRIGARIDLALTDEGRNQSRRLGKWFAREGVVFDRALCGPLRRTVETAELILAAQPSRRLQPVIDDRLIEIDHGVDEGCVEHDVRSRLGDQALDAWERNGTVPPGWQVDEPERIAFWRTLYADRSCHTTLLVTSNGAARFALLALPPSRRPTWLKLRTAAFGKVVCSADEVSTVECWDIRHV